MKVVLIGGSGATGRALVDLMLKSDKITEIVVLLRRISFKEHTKLKQVVVNFDSLADFDTYIQGDVAISCLGTTIKDAGGQEAQWKIDHDLNLQFAALAKKNDCPVFVLLSAVNADPKSKIFYNRMKGSLEQHIKSLDFKKLIIVQPGGLIRPNTDRLGEKISIGALRIFNSIGLFKTYEALPVAQVAAAMLHAIDQCREKMNLVSVKDIKTLTAANS